MLTFFSVPKVFRKHFEVIQRNAIRSWLQVCPGCEVILLGDDEGTAEVAKELGVAHLPQIARNEYGTPLLNSIFASAQKAARFPYLCYVNADIILLSDFLPAAQRVMARFPSFLMVGRKWNLEVTERLSFENGWEAKLRSRVEREGELHSPAGKDYFVFPRGLWAEIPPFALGRRAWDGWLLYQATLRKTAVVDATKGVTIVHQNHDYSHSPGGKLGQVTECEQNYALAGGLSKAYSTRDARYYLTRKRIRRRLFPYEVQRVLTALSDSNAFFRGLRMLKHAVIRRLDRSSYPGGK